MSADRTYSHLDGLTWPDADDLTARGVELYEIDGRFVVYVYDAAGQVERRFASESAARVFMWAQVARFRAALA